MALFTRDNVSTLLKQISNNETTPVYLLIGDRFLCQQTSLEISSALLGEGGTVHPIDGENENIGSTISKLRSFSLLPGRQVYKVIDSKLFHSKNIAGILWKNAMKANHENNPQKAAGYLSSMLQIAGISHDPNNQNLESLTSAQWKKFFGFSHPDESLEWTSTILSSYQIEISTCNTAAQGDPETLLENVLNSGIPSQNYLMLLSEVVDKRKRFFKLLKEQHTIIDMSVDTGSSASAKKSQRIVLLELINNTLAKFKKTIQPRVAELLIERVGFHPVAAVMESEKLAMYTGDNPTIEQEDLDALVGRTRQEALFELTEALGNKNIEMAMLLSDRLQDNGIHALAIIATLRNFAINLLLFRSLQSQPLYGYSSSMSPTAFQNQCLPELKNTGKWPKELSIHPYALYMKFKTASTFSLTSLQNWLELLLAAELKLKGSPIDSAIVIQHLILTMLTNTANGTLKKSNRELKYSII